MEAYWYHEVLNTLPTLHLGLLVLIIGLVFCGRTTLQCHLPALESSLILAHQLSDSILWPE